MTGQNRIQRAHFVCILEAHRKPAVVLYSRRAPDGDSHRNFDENFLLVSVSLSSNVTGLYPEQIAFGVPER
jgi:hypothetical protein